MDKEKKKKADVVPAVGKINESIMVSVDKLHPNPWNPNEQTAIKFNELVKEIEEEGFDGAIEVVNCNCSEIKGPHYMIIGGEHRWKVLGVLGWLEIPVIVKPWDDVEKQKLKTVRKNLLTGDLNDRKFTELVNSLSDSVDIEDMPSLMGFDTEEEFTKHLLQDKEEKDKSWMDTLMKDSKKEVEAVDAVSDVLNNIFADYGETVPSDFLFFAYKGRTHLLVMMQEELKLEVEGMVKVIKENDLNINDYLLEVLKNGRDE